MLSKALMLALVVGVASAGSTSRHARGLGKGKGYGKERTLQFTTFADGRPDGGIRQSADVEDGKDSPGDVFVFDQKLLSEDGDTVIGRNAGYCIRTDPGVPEWTGTDHPTLPDDPNNNWGQCTWTLTFYKTDKCSFDGTIQVSGRESDQGTSFISIVGGTGDFKGAWGELATTPEPQAAGGVLFRQELEVHYRKKW